MATRDRRRERYATDEDYRERRKREAQEQRAAAKLASLREKRLRGWKPIHSAPDNEVILLYDPHIFWPIVGALEGGHWTCVHYTGPEPRPTHWRYLLEVPLRE